MKKLITTVAILALSSVVYGQEAVVKDGVIWFEGTITGLAGIEATSVGGHLSLDFITVDGVGDIDLKLPFNANDGTVVANTPNSVVIGVLGADKRINIRGSTATSILYAGDCVQDLTVNVGAGDSGPGPTLTVRCIQSQLRVRWRRADSLVCLACGDVARS